MGTVIPSMGICHQHLDSQMIFGKHRSEPTGLFTCFFAFFDGENCPQILSTSSDCRLKSETIGPLPIFLTLKHLEYRVSVCINYESSLLDVNISSSGDKEKKNIVGEKKSYFLAKVNCLKLLSFGITQIQYKFGCLE